MSHDVNRWFVDVLKPRVWPFGRRHLGFFATSEQEVTISGPASESVRSL